MSRERNRPARRTSSGVQIVDRADERPLCAIICLGGPTLGSQIWWRSGWRARRTSCW